MAVFQIETKNQVQIEKKPRVYFTCHPKDFDTCFKRICADIFQWQDCAIYYTADMSEAIPREDRDVDLGRHNLFVVPVTCKLLTTPNRAMDEDIPYALQEHIPILPIMMESGLDHIYSLPNKFSELQYLNPQSTDTTEISYAEKLKKYLDAVLISKELADRVRAAFDAYIFLSYRKKDRKYANELMRLIHSYPELRDIAIWFDEFLTPGESFRENIDKILRSSKLFALLVTPNLLEEPDGKPNFVMSQEYPAAGKAGITVLPTEMVPTDRALLREKFRNIPHCVTPQNAEFHQTLVNAVSRQAIATNNSPEHNFLVGLAYLDGIDVEVNRQWALELITQAGEAGLPEAMQKLYKMYCDGIGVGLDYQKAVSWGRKYADYAEAAYGPEDPKTLDALNVLAYTCGLQGDYPQALELKKKVYTLRCKVLGEAHPDTLHSLNNLAATYVSIGHYREAAEIQEKVCALCREKLGIENPHTIGAMGNYAAMCGALGDYEKAVDLLEDIYANCCSTLGKEHPQTMTTLRNLAVAYGFLGKTDKKLELMQLAYQSQRDVLGQEHPNTLVSLKDLAAAYSAVGNYQEAMKLGHLAWELQGKVLGQQHHATLQTLCELALTYRDADEPQTAFKLSKQAYDGLSQVLGEEHPDTLTALNNIAVLYADAGDFETAAELLEKSYNLQCRTLGEDHPGAVSVILNLVSCYVGAGNLEKALEAGEKSYASCCKAFGQEHPDTMAALASLALCYLRLDRPETALPLYEKLYAQRVRILGEDHPGTQKTRSRLEETRAKVASKA